MTTFAESGTFVEVGSYLGRSLCSLAEVVKDSNREFTVVGVDNCRGSGREGTAAKDSHAAAVADGGGTLAGQLHRNVIACGVADRVHLLVGSSPAAAALFADGVPGLGTPRCPPRVRQRARRHRRLAAEGGTGRLAIR